MNKIRITILKLLSEGLTNLIKSKKFIKTTRYGN